MHIACIHILYAGSVISGHLRTTYIEAVSHLAAWLKQCNYHRNCKEIMVHTRTVIKVLYRSRPENKNTVNMFTSFMEGVLANWIEFFLCGIAVQL